MEATEKAKSWGVTCVEEQCRTQKSKGGLTFHYFLLKHPGICKKWAQAAKLKFQPTPSDMFCENHFCDEDYKTAKRKHLKDNAVPSISDVKYTRVSYLDNSYKTSMFPT